MEEMTEPRIMVLSHVPLTDRGAASRSSAPARWGAPRQCCSPGTATPTCSSSTWTADARPGSPSAPGPRAAGSTRTPEIAAVLKDVSAVAACLPYRLNLEVMEAALAAGTHYADLGGCTT